MISIPFNYHRYPFGNIIGRLEVMAWVENNNGKVIRRTGQTNILGTIKSIDFECEEDAVAFKLRFGL